MVITASKDTTWLYPSYFNPLLFDKKILVTIESNLDSDSYITFSNMSSKSVTVYNAKKEVKTKISSKRLIPQGLAKTYFFENCMGTSQFKYLSNFNKGRLEITVQEVELNENAPLGFTHLQGAYQKQVVKQSTF